MKIFGRGKNTEATSDDDLDMGADDAAFDDAGLDSGLTASPRSFSQSRAGGNRKFILLVALLLVLGGGYAALSMMSGGDADTVAVLPPPEPLGTTPIDATVAADMMPPNGMPPMPATADAMMPPPDAMIVPADGAMPPMPPMPTPPPSNVTAAVTAPASDPAMAGMPAPDGTAPGTPPAMPPTVVDTTAMPLTDANGAPIAPATDAPPPMDAIDSEAAASMPGDMPDDAMMQAPDIASAAPAPTAAMTEAPADPAAAAVASAVPGAPVAPIVPGTPPVGPTAAGTAPADPAAVATGPATGTVTTPTTAEQALMDNAALLPPADMGPRTPQEIAEIWASLPVEQAMVRPLPKQYLTVKKERSADSLDSRLASARRALNEGRTSAALQFFNELRMDYPSDSRVLMGRAVALQRLGQNAEALESYEAVLTNDPKNLDALTNMLGLLKSENPGLAIEKLVELRNVYPYNGDIATQLAVSYGQAGDLNEALRYMTLAEALSPSSSYVLYNKAILYDRMGRTTEAADMYRRLIRQSAEGDLDQNLPMESVKRRLSAMP